MKTKTIFLNKWAVLFVAVLLFGGAFMVGVDAAYMLGKGLVYLLVLTPVKNGAIMAGVGRGH
jgi:actin-like ATPase involved in cell morphogenesis